MGALVAVASLCLLFLLVFGISASVDTGLLRSRFRTARGILVGLFCQFVLLPFVGFCTVKIFDLREVFGITLIATTCSPGGAYSNWWCSLFNADLALSLAMTTCSTVLSVAFMPLNLLLYVRASYGASLSLEWWKLLAGLAVALAAICTGTAVSHLRPGWRSRCNALGNAAGIALVTLGAVASSRDDPLWDKSARFYAAVALPCLVGLTCAAALSWCCGLEAPQRVAVTVETSYQNTGIALSLALASFPAEEQSAAAGVPLFYGLVEIVVLPLYLLLAWRLGMTYAPPRENILRVLLYSHQPQQQPPSPEGGGPASELIAAGGEAKPPGAPAPACLGLGSGAEDPGRPGADAEGATAGSAKAEDTEGPWAL